jgi:hypothetical protein
MSLNDVQVIQVSLAEYAREPGQNGIDAAVLTIPSMFVAEDRGYRVLIDMADTDIYYLHTMIGDPQLHQKPRQGGEIPQGFSRRAGRR